MVVDSHRVVREVIKLTLEDVGYRVLEAHTPSAAIEVIRENPNVDLLIADVVLPETDGFELSEKITSMRPGVHVLYTSAYADASELGHFIRKPFRPAELVEKVATILG